MYKVLLVDDELPDLERIRRFIPWEKMNMEVIGTSTNGMDALSILSASGVNILVTDIKMPMMSGLELVERALDLNSHLKVIFVSSYDDFEYAKQAVSLKAFGYVLKPVNDQEIMDLLIKTKRELDRENAHAPMIRNQLLQQWFLELIKVEDVLKVFPLDRLIAKGGKATVAIIEIDHRMGMKKDLLIATLANIVQSNIPDDGLSIMMRWFNASVVVILQGDHKEVTPILQRMLETAQDETDFTITIGLGSHVSDPNCLQTSFKQAKQTVQSKLFVGKDRIITPIDAEGKVGQQVMDLEERIALLLESVSAYSIVEIHDHVEDIFLVHRCTVSVYHMIYYILSQVEMYVRNQKENIDDILGVNYEALHIIFEYETITEMKRKLREILFQCAEKLHFKRKTVPQKLVIEIERYVMDHLNQKITLKDIGNYLAFSGNYLAYLYKNNTGVSFSDFVVQTRMKKAKELLHNPLLKIFEIAEMVGYRDLSYFTKQFKEYTGQTPSEYRKVAK